MGARSEANGCAVIAQIEVASPVWADFSPVRALETVYGTDAGSKANDDGASRWCGSHTPDEFSVAVRIGCKGSIEQVLIALE